MVDIGQMTREQYIDMLGEFESDVAKYEREILAFWADFNLPNSLEHAKHFILRQWEKHGLPYGVKADVFLYYGLGFATSFPPSK